MNIFLQKRNIFLVKKIKFIILIGVRQILKIIKTYAEINQKIKNGTAVVFTAEEVLDIIAEKGIEEATRMVDVVTTGTFGPMCSSGAFINFGQSDPPIKMKKVWLNGVPAYGGLASVDAYLGVTEMKEDSDELYGGAHVIESIVSGEKITLKAKGGVTDCKPNPGLETYVDKNSLNQCILFNPRNAYQNYAAAINSTDKLMYTYMGKLKPNYGNITYSSAGQLSPLLNDPELRTIGIGSRIFLGGSVGYVSWNGTQHNPLKEKNDKSIPIGQGCTLSVVGDLKKMSTEYIKAMAIENYGVSLCVGIGIPIPILNEEMMKFVSVRDKDINTVLLDYGIQRREKPRVQIVNYEQLKSGSVKVNDKDVKTYPISSMSKARKIAQVLKEWIIKGEFLIQEPVELLPTDSVFKTLT